ncbi:hypothetical protein AAG570_014048 [Ranatra chinensis]|uniref:Ascorbate-specific PTS system EIIC component n=1 Tax=Ranatra chinensis TaxID=642074 RepID=A0ABD0Y7P0_9HEMI
MGLISLVGLLALKRPFGKVLVGTLKPILGYFMLGAGAGVIVTNLEPLGIMVENGFNIKGVVPNNEAIVSIAQGILGKETMVILLLGLIFNILIARFTKYKYIFLTGHHSFFMAALLSAVLGTAFKGIPLMLIGGFFLGAWSALSPAIGQKFTLKVTDGEEIAMGHFGSLGYYLSALVGKLVGDPQDSTEKMNIPDSLNFLRDTTISTALTMCAIYLVLALVNGPAFIESNVSGGTNFIIFAITTALKFAVGGSNSV